MLCNVSIRTPGQGLLNFIAYEIRLNKKLTENHSIFLKTRRKGTQLCIPRVQHTPRRIQNFNMDSSIVVYYRIDFDFDFDLILLATFLQCIQRIPLYT
jgi:hypothetical protein